MSFSHLATVELQLCMHFLDVHSFFTIARCSTFTLASASSNFAVRFLPPVPILFSSATVCGLASRLSRGLISRCDTHVIWRLEKGSNRLANHTLEEELQLLANVPRMRSIDTRDRKGIDSRQMSQLWKLIPRGRLKTVLWSDQRHVSAEELAVLISHHSDISSLTFQVSLSVRRSDLGLLGQLHSLTDVSLYLAGYDSSTGVSLRKLSVCTGLL